MSTTKLSCIDCGCTVTGSGQPKEVARKNQWTHVAKGAWRCPKCRKFLVEVGVLTDGSSKTKS